MSEKEKDTINENYNLDEDFEDEEEIITLYNEDLKKDEDFRVVWCLEYEDKSYVLLNSVEPIEGMGEDEVYIFEYGENEKGEEYVLPIESDEKLQQVYDAYVKEYEEAYGKDAK